MIISHTLEQIDRTMYENIRLVLVAKGFLPDVTTFTNAEAYHNAKVALGNNLVDIYGVGAAEARNAKTSHRIIIDRKGVNLGNLGSTSQQVKSKKGSTRLFQRVDVPEICSDIDYDLRIFSNSVATERKIFNSLLNVFGMRKYVPVPNDSTDDPELILVNFRGDVDMSMGDLRERLVKYTAMDVWLNQNFGDDSVVIDNIPPLSSINFQISVSGLSGTEETGDKILAVKVE